MFQDLDIPSPPGIIDSITQSFNTQTVQGGSPNINVVGNTTQASGTTKPYSQMTTAEKIAYDNAMRGI